MAPAVRKLEATLNDTKCGRFKPDETRSGRFVDLQTTRAQDDVDEGPDENEDSDS